MNNNLCVRAAKIEDFETIAVLEKNGIDEDIAFSKEQLLSFFLRNNNMFRVLVDENDAVLAFTLVSPITDNASKKFEDGVATDLADLQLDEIISSDVEDENIRNGIVMDYYFGDIVSNRDVSIVSLMQDIISNYVNGVRVIYSTPVTENGYKLLQTLGFVKIKDTQENFHVNYKLDVASIYNAIKSGTCENKSLFARMLKRNMKGSG